MPGETEVAARYLPREYPEEAPFWAGVKRGELWLQVCDHCKKAWYPIGPVCPTCLSDEFTWTQMAGHGHVSTYVVFHKAWAPWLESRVPYVVAQVELDEGPRLTTNILNMPYDQVRIGLEVKAAYEQVNVDTVLLQFEPVN